VRLGNSGPKAKSWQRRDASAAESILTSDFTSPIAAQSADMSVWQDSHFRA